MKNLVTDYKETVDRENNSHYDSINGLRAFAAIGIIMMHMGAKTNNAYEIEGVVFKTLIPSFTNFVFLFMIVSAFGICNGYYERISKGEITPSEFYEKRYAKILPFFSLLVLLDVIISPGINSLIEAFANITLCFGLLPNPNIGVIGVGWFLGTVFVFYMMFPFICFLMRTKKRACFAFGCTVMYNIVCTEYFMDAQHVVASFNKRSNIMFSAVFFMSGCIIYMFRKDLCNLVKKEKRIALFIVIVLTITYYFIYSKNENWGNLWLVILFDSWLIYAIGTKSKLLDNKITRFLSNISMEVYLSHMVMFRIIEKMHLNFVFGAGWLSYITTVIIVIVSSILFSVLIKKLLNRAGCIRKLK
ncbi:MAG: acyltransferase [Lachnospiraceae bacterium]|nr:acyltransferase [Lachnospiraceae bacterium]